MNWVEKLSLHFRQHLGETPEAAAAQYEIFLEQLVGFTDYQLEIAFTRALNECTFLSEAVRNPPANP